MANRNPRENDITGHVTYKALLYQVKFKSDASFQAGPFVAGNMYVNATATKITLYHTGLNLRLSIPISELDRLVRGDLKIRVTDAIFRSMKSLLPVASPIARKLQTQETS